MFFFLLGFLANLVNQVNGQSYPFRKYSVLDGLPQSQTTHISQDTKGFIWIATRNGISRFDGIEFVNYFRKDGLPSNLVFIVFEDLNGDIMALTKEGISVYNGYGFDFYPLPSEFSGWYFASNTAVDNNNNIFLSGIYSGDSIRKMIVFKDRVYSDYARKYPVFETLQYIDYKFNLKTNEMFSQDNKGLVWKWKDNVPTLISNRKFKSFFLSRNTIIAQTNDSLFRYSDNNLQPYKFNPTIGESAVNPVSTIFSNKVEFYDGKYTHFILPGFSYTGYLIDNEGAMWFTSEGNLYRLLSTAFNVFSEQDIDANNIWALTEDRNGHILFGSLYNRLVEFDGKEFRDRNEFRSLYKRDISFYKGSRRMANGDNWISTNDGVLIWNGNSFSRLKGIPEDTQICYVYEDPNNKTVMLGTEKGLFILKEGKIDLIPEFIDEKSGVIEGIAKDDNGSYWLSGHRGVFKFDGKNSIPVREDILPQVYTYTIEKDNFGGLWVTSEEGLFFRGKLSDKFVNALPEAINRSANSIKMIDSTKILVGRVSDICLIDLEKFYRKENNYFRLYDNSDGFLGSDCLDNGIIKDQYGRFWILTSENVVIFDPKKLKVNQIPPKVSITGLYYQTDSLIWETIDDSNFYKRIPDNIKLKRYQNTIQISFTGISTTNPEKVRLQYRLLGHEDKWSLPSDKRYIVYDKLPPGQYVFEAKATNADGIESVQAVRMGFRVLPAFWQTRFFIIGLLILMLFLTVVITSRIIRRRHKRQKEKDQLKSELSRLQMSSVLRQFDPHFTFNVISSVGSLVMKGQKEEAYLYITKLSGLLRTVLSDGVSIVKPLNEEINFVRKYCELQKLRFRERFNFSISVDEKVDLQRDVPKMTIQTFVENSIKHGIENRKEGGNVDVLVECLDGNLIIKIRDNGIGRIAALRKHSEGTGHGLKIMGELLEVMNKVNSSNTIVEITDLTDNDVPSGTEVRIFIPADFRFEFEAK